MTVIKNEDWLDILQNTDYIPLEEEDNLYQSYRFVDLDINKVTIRNFKDKLPESLLEQVEMFIPPSGSFGTEDLRRYLDLIRNYETSTTDLMLGLSLADQIRITFSDMRTSTICDRYPDINLAEKRRYRCVAEYLIRQGELTKLRDKEGKLIKKIGNMQKAVVLYQPLPKLLETLKKSKLDDLIKSIPKDQSEKKNLKIDRLKYRIKTMTNRRNQLLLKLFKNTTGETEDKLLQLSIERVLADQLEYFKKFYSNEGPGVIVFRPDFPEKEQMEYVSVNRLINILEKAKEAGQNCEIISKAINMAEAVDGEKEGLFIIEDEKDTQLFRINPERMVGSLL